MIVIANGQRVDAAKFLAALYKRAPGLPGSLSVEEAQFALDAANETRRNNRQEVGVLAFGWNTFRGRMLQVYDSELWDRLYASAGVHL